MVDYDYDIAVIGSGTGGYAAAIRASELGMRVALIEKDLIGGVCLNKGCIPTKALLQSAEVMDSARTAGNFGIDLTEPVLNWERVMAVKQETVARLQNGLKSLLGQHRINIIKGAARLERPGTISVSAENGETTVSAGNFIIAAGAAPKTLGLPIDGSHVITSDHALNLSRLPRSAIILGGGSIGAEFASMWRSFGTEVTIIEALPRILAGEDADISRQLTKSFGRRGINVLTSHLFKEVAIEDVGVAVTVSDSKGEKILKAEILLVAVGRGAESDNLGLSNWDIKTTKGAINVDNRLRTPAPSTFAVGDVIDTPQLAHVAFAEGKFAAEEAAGVHGTPIDYERIPRCVYTSPEVASVGLSESQALERGMKVKTAVFPFIAGGKAVIIGETDGMCKIIAEEDGPIVGVHMIGPRVTELIAGAAAAVAWEALAEEVASVIRPHPTLSEALGEAALKLIGQPLHAGL